MKFTMKRSPNDIKPLAVWEGVHLTIELEFSEFELASLLTTVPEIRELREDSDLLPSKALTALATIAMILEEKERQKGWRSSNKP